MSTFLSSMSPNTRLACTKYEDPTRRLLDANFSFMWRPPWLSKLSMCSPDYTTVMGTMALHWSLKTSSAVSPALSSTHLQLHHDQFLLGGGCESLLTYMFLCWSVILDLLWMCRAQQELNTLVVAEAPEEAPVVSADVDESVQTTVSTDLALISNSLAPSWLDIDKPVL